eukprot:4008880-Amphidinium_carterae.1
MRVASEKHIPDTVKEPGLAGLDCVCDGGEFGAGFCTEVLHMDFSFDITCFSFPILFAPWTLGLTKTHQ